MTQNREPPAFQEYTAHRVARTDYGLLLLGEVPGLTTEQPCWKSTVLSHWFAGRRECQG